MAERYGDYVVNAALGEGGLATVLRATDVRDGTEVALKILSRDRRADVPGLRDRLMREADVLRALAHIPAVVGMIEVFRDEPTEADVLVLELVRGEPLGDRFRARRPDVRTVLEWMGHVCHAMHDIHAAGYVHRDIKPDNLLLTDDPAVPLKIIDFNSAGRASAASGNLTRAQGAFPHTPAYLAPECFDGVPPDESADVYALGMTFAELLLGQHPLLPGEDDHTTQSAWHEAHEDVPFPTLPDVPPALQAVLERATAKDRADRIPDAVVLWGELKRVWEELDRPAEPEVVVPPPPPAPRVGFWAMTGVALLATLGTMSFAALWFDTAQQLQVAQDELDLHQRTIARLNVELEEAKKQPTAAPLPQPVRPSTLAALLAPKNTVGSGVLPPNVTIGGSKSLADLIAAPKVETQVLIPGLGPPVKLGDTIEVDYTITLQDGTVIDRSQKPYRFEVGGNQVIQGFSQGVIGMQRTERRRVTIPPALGYGDKQRGPIPPNSTLIATIDLRRTL